MHSSEQAGSQLINANNYHTKVRKFHAYLCVVIILLVQDENLLKKLLITRMDMEFRVVFHDFVLFSYTNRKLF